MKIFQGVGEFFRFAVPSALMVCLEWWSYEHELLILLSGILTNPQLETSVLSVCMNTIYKLYAIPYGYWLLRGSTRISNKFGAGKPREARISLIAMMLLIASINAIIVSTILFASRNVFGYIFSNETEVVEYLSNMAPLLCLSAIIDSTIQGSLSDIARGCGWHDIGAYINLAVLYVFRIPIAATLSFWLSFRGKGLWIGMLCGATLQTVMLGIKTSCTNWDKEADKAKERLIQESSSSSSSSVEGGLT